MTIESAVIKSSDINFMTKLGYSTAVLLIIILIGGGYFTYTSFTDSDSKSEEVTEVAAKPADRVEEITIQSGETFNIALERANIDIAIAQEIVNASLDIYNLATIHAGNIITILYDGKGDTLKKIIYEISSEEELVIVPDPVNVWSVERVAITYEIETAHVDGAITSSLYEAAKKRGADDAIIIEFATVFQWSIDFALETKTGDTYNFIYQKRYRNGDYIDTGRVLAGTYTSGDTIYKAYFFEESPENIGYFDAEGNSLRREFLKAPGAYKYISSGFTLGRRYVAEFSVSTGHRAVDYAAPYGTPIRSVGDGTVVFAGWNGSYGYYTSIRHSDTYITNYAHQSRIAVSKGEHVSQGEIIGYVGSTGFSTGPHVHYEMEKYGTKINPLKEKFPPGEPKKEEDRERFQRAVDLFNKKL